MRWPNESRTFSIQFWIKDHFAEYLHPKRGLIANHGLTDVDWAAIATGSPRRSSVAILWPQLKDEKLFHYGGMPTGIATRPEKYEEWEFMYPDRKDVASMGRVWYLEAWARARMGDGQGSVGRPPQSQPRGESPRLLLAGTLSSGWKRRGRSRRCREVLRVSGQSDSDRAGFLLGIRFCLDGTLVIAPTAPEGVLERRIRPDAQHGGAALCRIGCSATA